MKGVGQLLKEAMIADGKGLGKFTCGNILYVSYASRKAGLHRPLLFTIKGR